jgi:hypothetical protein
MLNLGLVELDGRICYDRLGGHPTNTILNMVVPFAATVAWLWLDALRMKPPICSILYVLHNRS